MAVNPYMQPFGFGPTFLGTPQKADMGRLYDPNAMPGQSPGPGYEWDQIKGQWRQGFTPTPPPIDPATGQPMGSVLPPGVQGPPGPGGPGSAVYSGGTGLGYGNGGPKQVLDGSMFGPPPIDPATGQPMGSVLPPGPNYPGGPGPVQPPVSMPTFGGGGPMQAFTPQAPGIDPETGAPMGQVQPNPQQPPGWVNPAQADPLTTNAPGFNPTATQSAWTSGSNTAPSGWRSGDTIDLTGFQPTRNAAFANYGSTYDSSSNPFQGWGVADLMDWRNRNVPAYADQSGLDAYQANLTPGSGWALRNNWNPAQAKQYDDAVNAAHAAADPSFRNYYDEQRPGALTGGPGAGAAANTMGTDWLPGVGQLNPSSGGRFGSGQGGGQGSSMSAGVGGNPYLSAMAGGIADTMTRQFQQGIMPQIRNTAQAAGGLGGSRQGVAEGLAAQGLQQQLGSALTSLYGGAYESDANRGLQRYGIDTGAGVTMRGQDLSQALGLGQLGLGYYGADTNRMLGLGGLGIQQQAADTNRLGTVGNLALGGGQLALGNRQADNAYNLGLGNLGLGYYGADTSRLLGLGQLGLGQQAQDTSRMGTIGNLALGGGRLGLDTELGRGNLALGNTQANNQYNLGLGNLALGNRNTDLAGTRLGYDLFTGGVNNAIGWNNALYNQGQADLNAPMGPINQISPFLAQLMAATGSGNVTMPGQGGGWTGALGGALTGAQLARMFFGGP